MIGPCASISTPISPEAQATQRRPAKALLYNCTVTGTRLLAADGTAISRLLLQTYQDTVVHLSTRKTYRSEDHTRTMQKGFRGNAHRKLSVVRRTILFSGIFVYISCVEACFSSLWMLRLGRSGRLFVMHMSLTDEVVYPVPVFNVQCLYPLDMFIPAITLRLR